MEEPVRRAWRRLRAWLRGLAFLALTLALLPVFVAASPLGALPRRRLRQLWCRLCLALLGLEVSYRGHAATDCATLLVANHVSYLDILLLGARTDATFIAKAEVAGWPLFGPISRAAGTFFVRRHWRDAFAHRNDLAARPGRRHRFTLVAGGPNTHGLHVLPVKTSLLRAGLVPRLDGLVAVQPVTLAYRALACGTPIGPANCHHFAWFGDATMVSHLWAMLHQPGCRIEGVFGAPVLSWNVTCRKALGRRLRQVVQTELAATAAAPPAPAASAAGDLRIAA